MKDRFLKILCVLCLAPLLLSGCWYEDTEEPDSGQLLVSQEQAEPQLEDVILPTGFTLPYLPDQTMDPVTCADGMQQVVGALLYEGLFQLDERLEPQQVLCSGYTYDPETYTYVFTLRTGVVFTDGTPLTAGDVVQTLRRAKSSARYGERLKNVASITAGEGSVTVVLTGPGTGLDALLDIPIVKAGTESAAFPTGTGPYAYSGEGGPHLTANPHWWQSGKVPAETIGLSAAEDRDTMLYQFTSHDIQLITADLTGTAPVSGSARLADLLRRPQLHYEDIAPFDPDRPELPSAVREQVEIQLKYAGYLARQQRQVEEFRREENRLLPPDVDYQSIGGLRLEARQKLSEIRPASIGQAGRISGVSPADIAVLLIYLEQQNL